MTLKREIQPMADFVKIALEDHDLMVQYTKRPPYQQNDYLGWINRAVKPETKQKRLRQMLDELKNGHLYMNMKYSG